MTCCAIDASASTDSYLSDEITQLKARVSALEGSITALQSTVTNLAYDFGEIVGHVPTIGTIRIWPSTSGLPLGWVKCEGQLYNEGDAPDLFAVIGRTFGGSVIDATFAVPDLRGRVPVGLSSGDTEFDSMGESGGDKTVTLTQAQMPVHTHPVKTRSVYPTTGAGEAMSINGTSTGGTTEVRGGGGSHPNLQPYLTLCFIIRRT